MNKTAAIVLALATAIIAIAIPVLVAIHLARQQSIDEGLADAMRHASDILRRAEETGNQAQSAIASLVDAHETDPCSEKNIALMRALDISSSYLQAVGHVEHGQLVCSSLAGFGKAIDLGPVEMVGRNGALIRTHVALPIAPGQRYLILEQNGYAVIIHFELILDIPKAADDTLLGVFSYSNGQLLVARGALKPEWAAHLADKKQTAFIDGDYAVAALRSDRFDVAAVTALPTARLHERVRGFALVMVPIGIAVGLLLTLALLYLAKQQMSLPAMMRLGLKRHEFFLLYQPIVDLRTREWIGVEALMRWRRSSGEVVRPEIFIKAAEDAGMIQRMTERVIEIVARDMRDVFRAHPRFHVSINLAPEDLQSERTLVLLRNLMRDTHAGPRNAIVEATERGLPNAELARRIIHDVRMLGPGVALDDFGTGYSSLSYLETLELDYIKIDKSFVDTVGTDSAASQVIHHIIEIGKSLKLEMIAEGVETETQAAFLLERGVQYAQGWLFAKALPIDEVVRHLSGQSPDA